MDEKKRSISKETKQPMPKYQKTILRVLIGFFVLILLFTILSRAVDSLTVPVVQTTEPKSGNLEFVTTADGQVEPRKELSLSLDSGYKIKDILVREGQEVKEGDVLIELDLESIQKKIDEAQLAYDKALLSYDMAHIQEGKVKDNTAMESALERKERTLQDSQKAEDEKEQAVVLAMEDLQKAKDALVKAELNLEDSANRTREDDLKKAKEKVDNLVKEKEDLVFKNSQDLYIAQRDVEDAYKEYSKPIDNTGSDSDSSQYVDDTRWRRAQEDYAIKQQNADIAVKKKQEEIDKAVAEYNEVLNKPADEYDVVKTAQSQVEQCKVDIESKERALQKAIDDRDSQIEKTGRDVEDANLDIEKQQIAEAKERKTEAAAREKEALSKESDEMDLDVKRRELELIQRMMQDGADLKAPQDGVITKISVNVGATSSGETAITMSDNVEGMIFKAVLNTEDCKYIKRGDAVKVTPAGSNTAIEGAVVEGMQNLVGDKSGKTEVIVKLPETFKDIGVMATMRVERKSDNYQIVLPLDTINTENNKNYVFVLSEKETVLGKESIVERRDVNVIDKDKNNAAISMDGSLMGGDKIIKQSEKSLKNGDRVRINENAS